jgi:hypothetical protein
VTAVEGVLGEHYRRLIGEKTRDALAHLRARGRAYSHIAPYGLQKAQDGRLIGGARATLALIASLRASGASWRAICADLTARGITQRNGQPWSVALLHRVASRQPIVLSVDTAVA